MMINVQMYVGGGCGVGQLTPFGTSNFADFPKRCVSIFRSDSFTVFVHEKHVAREATLWLVWIFFFFLVFALATSCGLGSLALRALLYRFWFV